MGSVKSISIMVKLGMSFSYSHIFPLQVVGALKGKTTYVLFMAKCNDKEWPVSVNDFYN